MDVIRRGRAPVGDDLTAPHVRFARWGGAFHAGLGIVGFGVTGVTDPLRTVGERLAMLEVNPLQNLLHLAIGLALIAAGAAGPEPARIATLLAAASFGVAGLLGLALTGTDGNVLAVNQPANVLHLVTAGIAGASIVVGAKHHRRAAT
jgi:hypothetical protein